MENSQRSLFLEAGLVRTMKALDGRDWQLLSKPVPLRQLKLFAMAPPQQLLQSCWTPKDPLDPRLTVTLEIHRIGRR